MLGRREPGTVDVQHRPARRSHQGRKGAGIGTPIGAVGDVDGDGRPDLALGLPDRRAVIVRGGTKGTIDLAHPPAGATIAIGGLPEQAAGFAGVGDVDGDGRGEVLVGVPTEYQDHRGHAYVLRGVAGGKTIDARAALARLVGPRYQGGFGRSVATVPDSNGDGLPEWAIGESLSPGVLIVVGRGQPVGEGFVVFSSARGEVRPGAARQPVVDVRGPGISAGQAIAGVDDLTGDGIPDLLIGLPDASPSCRGRAGAVALVPGRRTPGTVTVAAGSPQVDGALAGGTVGKTITAGGGELFLGAKPFDASTQLRLWRVPLSALTTPSPRLPVPDDCLTVQLTHRTRASLLAHPTLHATIHSDAGDPHRLSVRILVIAGGSYAFSSRTLAPTPTVDLPLSKRMRALLRRKGEVGIDMSVVQVVGAGVQATSGAGRTDGFVLH